MYLHPARNNLCSSKEICWIKKQVPATCSFPLIALYTMKAMTEVLPPSALMLYSSGSHYVSPLTLRLTFNSRRIIRHLMKHFKKGTETYSETSEGQSRWPSRLSPTPGRQFGKLLKDVILTRRQRKNARDTGRGILELYKWRGIQTCSDPVWSQPTNQCADALPKQNRHLLHLDFEYASYGHWESNAAKERQKFHAWKSDSPSRNSLHFNGQKKT